MRRLRVILTWGPRPQTPGIYRIIARIGGVASQLGAAPHKR
jgi:hypothetical protein